MDNEQVCRHLCDFRRLKPVIDDTHESIIEVALFVEDVFNIILTDSEIDVVNLGSHESLKRFILQKLQLEDSCAGYVE
jgi:hypothetical protein